MIEDRSEKYHYAILEDGKEEIVYWFKGLKYPYCRGWCYQVCTYLAPVPSYEEWQEKTKSLKVLAEAYCKEKQKNDEIKELLKECKPYVNSRFIETREHLNKPYTATDKVLHKRAEKLLAKIDEALK